MAAQLLLPLLVAVAQRGARAAWVDHTIRLEPGGMWHEAAGLPAGSKQDFQIQPCKERGVLSVEVWAEHANFDEGEGAAQLTGVQAVGQSSAGGSDPRSIADPMLLLAEDERPWVMYDSNSRWVLGKGTTADLKSYQLLAPYHRVTKEYSGSGKPFYAQVYNVDKWMKAPFKYHIMASCHEEPPCPAPLLLRDEPLVCSKRGTCTNEGMCTCDSKTQSGGVGCEVTTTQLEVGEWHKTTSSVAAWDYYAITVEVGDSVRTDSPNLLVEMKRTRGDPVLFVKHAGDGFLPGGVPTVFDYQKFADTDSFRSRLNYHYRLINAKPGTYYIAVFNNDVYIKENARYEVRVTKALPTKASPGLSPAGLCPANCHADNDPPHGMCGIAASGKDRCECKHGYGGPMCEGRLTTVEVGKSVEATIQPAHWLYFRVEIKGGTSGKITKPLQVVLWKNGGHPVLLARWEAYPTLLQNDFIFTMSQHLEQETSFQVEPKDLRPGTYIFGVYNMDYYKHESGRVKVSVDMSSDTYLQVNPFMSIILGVISSMFLCLFMSVCKKLFHRHSSWRRENETAALQTALANTGLSLAGGPFRAQETRQRNGLPPEAIAAIPEKAFEEGMLPKEDAHCAVCLGDYELGDRVKELPCGHLFHTQCIAQWLDSSTLCPLCRENLASDGNAASAGAASAGIVDPEVGMPSAPPPQNAAGMPEGGIVSVPLTPPARGASSNASRSALRPSPPQTPPGGVEADAEVDVHARTVHL